MYIITHKINGSEQFREEMPIGTLDQHLAATQRFGNYVFGVLSTHLQSHDPDDPPMSPWPDGVLEQHTQDASPFMFTDTEGNDHEFCFLIE